MSEQPNDDQLRQRRLDELIAEVRQRLAAGEDVSDAALIEAHPGSDARA